MDIQQSCSYYWIQGDFCKAIFSLHSFLFTGEFSYLVHLAEWGHEIFKGAAHKWLKWEIRTEIAELKNKAQKSTYQKSWSLTCEAVMTNLF